MDLGVFCPIVNNHNVVSTNLNHYEPTWDLNRSFVQTAEEAGFKFASRRSLSQAGAGRRSSGTARSSRSRSCRRSGP
jgi:hypothetical protein